MELEQKTKHPKGLWVLFGTEMWERFNFYGMRALLALFFVNALMMDQQHAALIYGGFLGLCYLTPMLGGFISDKFLGNRNCILLGGTLMAIGQLLLFSSASVFSTNLSLATTLMWIALGVIIFGNGFFKPNISSMVGSLYPKTEKNKLDTAFTIFYMGINLGALLGQAICPILGDRTANGVRDVYAFRWGFLAAAGAMMLGTTIFLILKNKYIRTPEGNPIGGLPSKHLASDYDEGESQKAVFSSKALVTAGIAWVILACLFYFVVGQNIIYSIIYASGISLAGLIISDNSLTKIEKDRIFVIYIVVFFIIFFWAAFEQAGSSLTFIANNQTDRHILGWDVPPSMVQIFNGIFVVLLALPFSFFWDRLRKKNREPIAPVKQATGLLLIALSYFIIAYNVKYLGNALLSVYWLVLLYFIQTCGELCLSPIGLSLVGKLAPKRFASLLYGVFFLSNASGYALAGTLGSILPPTGDKYQAATEHNINLTDVLEGKTDPSSADLITLAQLKIASVHTKEAKDAGIDPEALMKEGVTLSDQQMSQIKSDKIITVSYPKFAGVVIHNLFEFFMVFVVLTGIASVVLYLLSPFLKKMMHGVR